MSFLCYSLFYGVTKYMDKENKTRKHGVRKRQAKRKMH